MKRRGPSSVWGGVVYLAGLASWGCAGKKPLEPLPPSAWQPLSRSAPPEDARPPVLAQRLARFRAQPWRHGPTQPQGPWPLEVQSSWRRLLQAVEMDFEQPLLRSELVLLRVGLEAEMEFTQRRFGPAPDHLLAQVQRMWLQVDHRLRPPAPPRPVREWPVTPVVVTSEYGWREDPLAREMRFHAGIDFGGGRGDVVTAAASGTVHFVGWSGGYGRLVVLDHGDGWQTWYGHLQQPLVDLGTRVEVGSPVGLMGSSGRSTGPHLHFEVRYLDEPRPPREFLNPADRGGAASAVP